jgi:hypothetical protein
MWTNLKKNPFLYLFKFDMVKPKYVKQKYVKQNLNDLNIYVPVAACP